MKKIVIGLDDTIAVSDASANYSDLMPNKDVVEKLLNYKSAGFNIAIYSARNMRTFNGNIGQITAKTLPIIIKWLTRHNVPFDEIFVGKPWCGDHGFYVDDKAIRPDEFVNLSYKEICAMIGQQPHND